MFAYVNVESPEPIQPDITGASSAVPPLQTEATIEKGIVSSSPSILL